VIASVWVTVFAVAVLFYGSPRFRLPAEVVALLFVPAGARWLAHRVPGGGQARS
jgi:hypothetical protein